MVARAGSCIAVMPATTLATSLLIRAPGVLSCAGPGSYLGYLGKTRHIPVANNIALVPAEFFPWACLPAFLVATEQPVRTICSGNPYPGRWGRVQVNQAIGKRAPLRTASGDYSWRPRTRTRRVSWQTSSGSALRLLRLSRFFQRFQEDDEVTDLVRLQPELRHARMASSNPLR